MANITEYIIRVTDRGSAAIDRITQSADNLFDTLGGIGAQFQNAIGDIPIVGNSLTSLLNPTTAIIGGVTALGAAYVNATQKSLEWAENMANVNVTAELNRQELKGLSDDLRTIGARNVAALEGVPEAYGRIISAGLSVNKSLETLEPTLRAAKAGFTDVATVASAGVSTMMAAGESANRVYDILFETVKEGNAEFKDIAQYLPKVVPLARNVGFALDETAGAYASLTGKLSAEQSTTALQGIMRSLSDPKVVKSFEKLGVQVFDKSTGAVRPLLEIIKDTDKKMSGLSDKARMVKFDSLKLDQMSTLGFATLTQDVEGLEKAINATVNSAGALEKAYADSLTPLDSWRIVQNKISAKMLEIGDTALPIITKLGEGVLGAVNYFEKLYDKSFLFREVLGLVGKGVQLLVDKFTFGFRLIGNVIKGIGDGVTWIAEKLGFVGFSFDKVGSFAENMWVKTKPYLLYVYELLSKIGEIGYKIATLQWVDAYNLVKDLQLPNLGELQNEVFKQAYGDNALDVGPQIPKAFGATFGQTEPVKPNVPAGLNDGVKAATSGGTRSTNITINIGKFQDAINIYSSVAEAAADIERAVTEAMTRALTIAQSGVR